MQGQRPAGSRTEVTAQMKWKGVSIICYEQNSSPHDNWRRRAGWPRRLASQTIYSEKLSAAIQRLLPRPRTRKQMGLTEQDTGSMDHFHAQCPGNELRRRSRSKSYGTESISWIYSNSWGDRPYSTRFLSGLIHITLHDAEI